MSTSRMHSLGVLGMTIDDDHSYRQPVKLNILYGIHADRHFAAQGGHRKVLEALLAAYPNGARMHGWGSNPAIHFATKRATRRPGRSY